MAEAPIWQFKTDAYLGDTGHLTTIEHGAYFLLLVTMFRNGGWLKNDPKLLRRYTKTTSAQWARMWPILEPFFHVEDGLLMQGHLTDTLDAVRQKSKSAQDSARARWRKTKEKSNANASNSQCERNANQEPRTKNQEREPSSKSLFAKACFEDWYSRYPRKIGKGAAEKAFAKASKLVDFPDLLSATDAYAESVAGKERQYIPHPATWLNGKRWLDEPEQDEPPPRKETYAEELNRRLGGDGANILRLEERR